MDFIPAAADAAVPYTTQDGMHPAVNFGAESVQHNCEVPGTRLSTMVALEIIDVVEICPLMHRSVSPLFPLSREAAGCVVRGGVLSYHPCQRAVGPPLAAGGVPTAKMVAVVAGKYLFI